MVFALETFWPAADGYSAARIEEQLVVTKDGCELLTRFPAEELMVTAGGYHSAAGPLPTTRETQSHLNRPSGESLGALAGIHGGSGGVAAPRAKRAGEAADPPAEAGRRRRSAEE
jgi:hypothetical protein